MGTISRWLFIYMWRHLLAATLAYAKRDFDAWSLLLLAAAVRSFAHMPLGISDRNTTTMQCCHCKFFSLDLGFFCFIWSSGFCGFYWKSGFFWLWSNFKNVCCITVFSIQECSSFTGAINVQSHEPVQLSRARLSQIVWNRMFYRLICHYIQGSLICHTCLIRIE